MARFRPFRAVRYSTARVGALDPVVAPPYDVISPAERDVFYEASPFNCTRLILNKESHDAAAAQYFAWQDEGVLERDDAPAFWLYVQDFEAVHASAVRQVPSASRTVPAWKTFAPVAEAASRPSMASPLRMSPG